MASLRNKRFNVCVLPKQLFDNDDVPQRLLVVKTALKLPLSMSSLLQSYTHRNSGNSESINSLEGCLPKKRVSFWPFLARRDRELETRVHINLTAAAQSFVWNI